MKFGITPALITNTREYQQGYERGQAIMLERILSTPLPCDVRLPLVTTFSAGTPIKTLFAGMEMKRPPFGNNGTYWNQGPVPGNTRVLVKVRVLTKDQYEITIASFRGNPGNWFLDGSILLTQEVLGWMPLP